MIEQVLPSQQIHKAPEVIEFSVHGEPVGQPRHRSQGRLSRSGRVTVHTYSPTHVKNKKTGVRKEHPIMAWKRAIEQQARPHMPREPWRGPIELTIEAYFERPGRLLKKKSPPGTIRHTTKPDRDNVEKAVLDVLKTLGMFVDDCQVSDGGVSKRYVAIGHAPGIRVVARRVIEQEGGELFG